MVLKIVIAMVVMGLLGVAGVYLWVGIMGKPSSKGKGKNGKTSDDPDEVVNHLVNERKAKKDRRRLNYRYAQDAPFFFISDDEVWTGLILESSQDDFMTYDEEAGLVHHLSDVPRAVLQFFEQFPKEFPGGVRCHEVTRYQPVNVTAWQSQYEGNMWDPSRLFGQLIDGGVAPHISESTPDRKRMLLVKMGEIKKATAMNDVDAMLNLDEGIVTEYFDADELDRYSQRARQLFMRMSHYGASPMQRNDLSWLVRKTVSGHFQPDDEIPTKETMPWRNTWFDRWAELSGDNLSYAVRISEPNPTGAVPGTSYTTTLTVADAETFVPFEQQNAWGKVLRTLPYPVEVSWRFYLMGAKQWGKKVSNRVKNLRDEQENRNKSLGQHPDSDTGDTLFDEKMKSAESLSKRMEMDPQPVMIGQLRLAVSAPTLSELDDAAREVINALSGSVRLERRRGLQLALLEEQLPGKVNPARIGSMNITRYTGGIVGGERWTDIEMMAMARLDSSPTVGDGVEYSPGGNKGWIGHFIGYARENGALAHFDPHVQIARNKGAGVAVIGASGGGKSTLSLMLFFWMSESGVQIVVIDPKDDFRAFVYYIVFGPQVNDPQFDQVMQELRPGDEGFPYKVINSDFWNDTEIIDLWRGRPGMLDPWLMCGGDFREGATLVQEIIDLLLSDKSERAIAVRALDAMKRDYDKAIADDEPYALGLGRLAEYISADMEQWVPIANGEATDGQEAPDVSDRMTATEYVQSRQDVVARLQRAADEQYAKLLFSDGSELQEGRSSGLQKLSKRRTIITVKGLKFNEDKDIDRWSAVHRNAAAALYTALHRITEFFTAGDRAIKPNSPQGTPPVRPPRALLIDEGYVITKIPAGKELVQVALRQGRSYNFVVIFISQQAKDVAELQASDGDTKDPSSNQFPTVFVFQQKSEGEARAALALLRGTVPDSPEDSRALSSRLLESEGYLQTGVCVMKDADNHVGVVCTDPLFDELWAATQTNAIVRGRYQDREISSDGRLWTADTNKRNEVRTGVVSGALEEMRDESRGQFAMDDWEESVGLTV